MASSGTCRMDHHPATHSAATRQNTTTRLRTEKSMMRLITLGVRQCSGALDSAGTVMQPPGGLCTLRGSIGQPVKPVRTPHVSSSGIPGRQDRKLLQGAAWIRTLAAA